MEFGISGVGQEEDGQIGSMASYVAGRGPSVLRWFTLSIGASGLRNVLWHECFNRTEIGIHRCVWLHQYSVRLRESLFGSICVHAWKKVKDMTELTKQKKIAVLLLCSAALALNCTVGCYNEGATSDKRHLARVWDDAALGNVEDIRTYLASGGDVNARCNGGPHQGMSLLHVAAANGQDGCVTFLLKHGADVNARSSHGYTPLHFARMDWELYVDVEDTVWKLSVGNRSSIAQLLIDAGAAIDAANEEGWTPLHSAALYGDHALAEVLIAHNAAVDVRAGMFEATPLCVAIHNGHVRTGVLLLAHNADVKDVRKDQSRQPVAALNVAALAGRCAMIEPLLRHGVEIDARSSTIETTALHDAIGTKHFEFALHVVLAGARTDIPDGCGFTAKQRLSLEKGTERGKQGK